MRISGKMSPTSSRRRRPSVFVREQLLEAAGLDVPRRGEPPRETDWDTFAAMLDELSHESEAT